MKFPKILKHMRSVAYVYESAVAHGWQPLKTLVLEGQATFAAMRMAPWAPTLPSVTKLSPEVPPAPLSPPTVHLSSPLSPPPPLERQPFLYKPRIHSLWSTNWLLWYAFGFATWTHFGQLGLLVALPRTSMTPCQTNYWQL